MRFTQQQYDRWFSTIFVGLCGSFIGLFLLFWEARAWSTVMLVAFYSAFGGYKFGAKE